MCESSVVLDVKGKVETLMEEVIHILIKGDNIELIGIFGERKNIRGRIVDIDMNKHEIMIKGEQDG
ncbi:MAG: CooT family nickel-binding protein [Methanocellales archaeon]|nr:CooT family nickel-binding protein [Methanocellales archaeon]MDD3291266.1 CooT family nickel-binding protein [Methanocellales archaeon]MDD5235438.1 CooT family nickel-binding protein [Methanocellales archaeon]MDD5484479.1 CooT family nickel-binding protein [Methanocellales archaeon]